MKRNILNSLLPLFLIASLGACTTTKTTDNWPAKKETTTTPPPVNEANDNGAITSKDLGTIGNSSPYANNSDAALDPKSLAAAIINIGDRVYFDTDSYTLTEKARDIISKQANVLIKKPGSKILIAGNCDERGTREYNIALGARRASAVRDFLVSLGVDGANISTISYGKERPIDDRPNEDGWAINRNAQTKVQ